MREVPYDLGKLIQEDVKLLDKYGWEELVKLRCPRDDFTTIKDIKYPAQNLLKQYK